MLQAYSVHDPEVGYCQGIGFIAGLLLMHVSILSTEYESRLKTLDAVKQSFGF